MFWRVFLCIWGLTSFLWGQVRVGSDVFFAEGYDKALLSGKRVGLITNQTAINNEFKTTFDLLYTEQTKTYQLKALFAPEHGFYGDVYAADEVFDKELKGIPLYSLHGKTRRPTEEMLANIDVLIYDIQDIGSRSYSFITTLFYCMEEAAKRNILCIVLDRPNPMGGVVVDGLLLEEEWRSYLGYINVPYCHGMTIGELAHLFNEEYQIGVSLVVIPMKGWKRGMTFADTGLFWVPTSPQIPEADSPFFYSTTGLIGHCSFTNIGVGYTLPFKVIGAPWICAEKLLVELEKQNLPGVKFQPFYFRPFFGKFKKENCQGVKIVVTDAQSFSPLTTQYTLLGVLKNLYPKQFEEMLYHLNASKSKREVFHKLNGSEKIFKIFHEEKYFIWKLREMCLADRQKFLPIRKKYLNPLYD